MHRITTRSPVVRTAHARAAAGLIDAGLYVVGGGLLVSHLLAGGVGPTDQSAPGASPALTSFHVPAAPTVDRGGTEMRLLLVYVEDGPTYHCYVPAYLVSNDAIVITSTDFFGMSGVLDCG